MFQLQVADADVTNGTIAVSWCLDHELLKDLADQKITDPQVVICVAPVDNYHLNKEYRKVVPLKDLMTYIEFRTSGKVKIWGLISQLSPRKARAKYLEKSDGEFITNILGYDGDKYSSGLLNNEDYEAQDSKEYKWLSQPLSVVVPKAVFAKEPPSWEKKWVNHYFRDKVVDQCEFRRRRLFAYVLQPWILLGNLFLRLLITLFAGLALAKGFTLKYLYHPLMYSLKDTFDIFEDGSLAIRHLPEDDKGIDKFPKPGYFVRSFWTVPLMPLIWLPMLLMFIYGKFGQLFVLSFSLIVVSLIILLVAVLANHAKAFKAFFARVWNSLTVSDELWYLDQKEAGLITCSDKGPLTYDGLPAHRKTVRLRVQNLKSKVCKPFSL